MAKELIGYGEDGPIYAGDPMPASKKTAPVKTAPAEPPGWFEPGSTSEAIVRGFANGATLGLAPQISAGVRSVTAGGSFGDKLREYLGRDKASAEAHPVASTVSNMVGGAPSMIASGAGSIPAQIAKQAGLGAISTVGNSDTESNDAGTIARDALVGGTLGAAVPAVLPVAGKVLSKTLDLVRGKADPRAITEAAIKFKNAPAVPAAGIGQPAPEIQRNLKTTYDHLPEYAKKGPQKGIEIDQIHSTNGIPLKGPEAAARGDQVMREILYDPKTKVPNVDNLLTPKEDLSKILDNHNLSRENLGGRTVMGSALGGAALGGAGGFWSSEGDLKTTLGGAAAGAMTGAHSGGMYNAVRNTQKLRMPSEPGALSKLAEGPLGKLVNQETSTLWSGDVKDKLETSTNPFAKLSNFLTSAQESDNPDVQAAAEEADASVDPNDPDSKRKAAMKLNGSATGRAVTNTDSPEHK
jgi:hypothetical protein